jgi:hypothetical protein
MYHLSAAISRAAQPIAKIHPTNRLRRVAERCPALVESAAGVSTGRLFY